MQGVVDLLKRLRAAVTGQPEPSARYAIARIRMAFERLNVPVIADDIDAGYDMAIDEVLDAIMDIEHELFHPSTDK